VRFAKMGARWMPWRSRPMKDAATRRNALGRCWRPAIQGSPNGATRPTTGRARRCNSAARARGELKHLSTSRKREDSPSSGERTGRSPNHDGEQADRRCRGGGRTENLEGAVDPSRENLCVSGTLLERAAGAGESPVGDGG